MDNNELQKKLNRFHEHLEKKERVASEQKISETYLNLARAVDGEICNNFAGSYCLVKKCYPANYQHGDPVLDKTTGMQSLPLSAFTVEDNLKTVPLSSLLFLDTETTGLGGTGAVAFLVGCGSFVKNGFEVRQYLVPDYTDETSMLESLLDELGPEKTLVTYNGAAFDIPLLRDRMIINRVGRNIEMSGHIDLLHPTRRLFRRRLAGCSLVNVEREIFAFERQDDIPGYLIPSVYFDWLNNQNPGLLPQVLEHNRLDIVSLCFLVKHLAEIYLSDGDNLTYMDDIHSLSRIYGRRKDNEKITSLYRRIDSFDNREIPDDMLWYHSLVFKKVKDFTKAVDLWQKLSVKKSREGFGANIELAKYYEHRLKDIDKAVFHTRMADGYQASSKNQKKDLEKRFKRLSFKHKHL